jgi:hypothetical protein
MFGSDTAAVKAGAAWVVGQFEYLQADLGKAGAAYHDAHVRGLRSRRVQCDEIWSFVGAKERNVTEEKTHEGCGDVWTWTALDDSKLSVSYLVGQPGPVWARNFMEDVASRIDSRIQITTDGHRAYATAVEGAFGMECRLCDAYKALRERRNGPPLQHWRVHRHANGCAGREP